jgi:hypothetical protein
MMEQSTLQKNIKMVNQKWEGFEQEIAISYDGLMSNEDFWNPDGHQSFQKLTGWHPLGHA